MPATPDDSGLNMWSRYLAQLGHEIRSPLHTIAGLSELLMDESRGPLNAEQRELMADIHLATGYLLRMVNDLLDISRLRNSNLQLDLDVLSLAAVVEQSLRLARGLGHFSQVDIEASVPHDLAVRADERLVLQVLQNLLSNAIRYSAPGAVVRIAAQPEDDVVWTLVQDDGHGIAPEDQERIFDPFVSIKCDETEPGVGLGLTVCRNMVEAMGGCIVVSSAPGEGSTFRFSLPRAQVPA